MAAQPAAEYSASLAALTYGRQLAQAAFDGRRGHGGGPCSYRIFRQKELAAILAIAFDAGVKASAKAEGRTDG